MIMYRIMPQDYRRVVVANSIAKKYGGVDVLCLRADGQKKVESQNGMNFHRLIISKKDDTYFVKFIRYNLFLFLCFIKIAPLSWNRKYDVMHIHNPPDFLVFAAIPYKLLFGTKIVLDLHDMLPEALCSNLNVKEDHIIVRIAKLLERIAIYFSDSVICTNTYDKEIILSRNRVNAEKIFIVMNTPDLNLFEVFDENKEQLGLGDQFVLLFEGTIWKRRGIQTVIDAVKLVQNDIPIKFVVVGDGPDLDFLIAYSKERKLDNSVLFTGWVDLETLSRYISVSDLCIIPFLDTNVNRRGVPNKLFEYIVHDKPVLSSRLKGISLTFNEDEVIFFEPGNAEDLANKLLWCYEHRDVLVSITQRAKDRYFAEYTWDRMEKELYRSYDSNIQSVVRS
jgi:glycosyltransferase involved in cell wall biosynthesis